MSIRISFLGFTCRGEHHLNVQTMVRSCRFRKQLTIFFRCPALCLRLRLPSNQAHACFVGPSSPLKSTIFVGTMGPNACPKGFCPLALAIANFFFRPRNRGAFFPLVLTGDTVLRHLQRVFARPEIAVNVEALILQHG